MNRIELSEPPLSPLAATAVAPAPPAADPVRAYATLTFVRGAMVSLAITVVAGMLGILFYIPAAAPGLMRAGIDFSMLRPVHTTFASAWIFLGGIAVVHHYLQEWGGPASRGDRWRLRAGVLLWAAAGLGILATLAGGTFSGREYMGFHPAFSGAILVGWLLFAWSFFRVTWRGFWTRPVYVTMWGVGIVFFVYTFVEQHAYLLPAVFADPLVDLRLQWKATGTLIGSFNLFVYGTLYYIGEKLSGDERYAHSRLAYALFGVGLLNAFTNFGHHTYHVPQSEVVKWISFVVSMTEVLILARVVWDIVGAVSRRAAGRFDLTRHFAVAAKWWTSAMLLSALLISVPPLNALIHGTHVVTAHAMGTEIGIDSMILFAALSWILAERMRHRTGAGEDVSAPRLRWIAIGLSVSAAGLIAWLHVSGTLVGLARYQDLPPPDWLRVVNAPLFAGLGLATAVFLSLLLAAWLRLAFGRGAARDDLG